MQFTSKVKVDHARVFTSRLSVRSYCRHLPIISSQNLTLASHIRNIFLPRWNRGCDDICSQQHRTQVNHTPIQIWTNMEWWMVLFRCYKLLASSNIKQQTHHPEAESISAKIDYTQIATWGMMVLLKSVTEILKSNDLACVCGMCLRRRASKIFVICNCCCWWCGWPRTSIGYGPLVTLYIGHLSFRYDVWWIHTWGVFANTLHTL